MYHGITAIPVPGKAKIYLCSTYEVFRVFSNVFDQIENARNEIISTTGTYNDDEPCYGTTNHPVHLGLRR